MTIIVDSNFLFALKFSKDKNSKRAIEILNELEENYKGLIITNYLVINEAMTLIVARTKANSLYLKKMADLIWGSEKFFKIDLITHEEYELINGTLTKFCTAKQLISYVDASILFLYEKYKADYILSFDSHFDNIARRIF